MSGEIYAPVEWRFTVLGPVGVGRAWKKITILSHLAQDVELLYQLNRSTMLTFNVPSDDPQVNIPHTDGLPYLAVGPRFVLGWRKSPPALTPYPGHWELKYAGRVWSLQDQGDGDSCRTMVVCFDMLKHLEKRIVRAAAATGTVGSFRNQVKFWAEPGTTIVKKMIDRTQAQVGTCRIDTAGGTWVESSPTTAAFDQAYVMPSILRVTDTGTMDLVTEPLDGTNGDFLRVGGRGRLGSDKPNVIMGYAAPPRRASGFDRTTSLDNLANSITLFGKSAKGHAVTATDSASQATYDIFEAVDVLSDIETSELLQMLATEEVALRRNPNDLVSIIPTPEDSPRFFNEYFIGDTIKLKASTKPFPVTRETITGLQRVYGARLQVDNEYGERVSELVASANAETS